MEHRCDFWCRHPLDLSNAPVYDPDTFEPFRMSPEEWHDFAVVLGIDDEPRLHDEGAGL